MKKNIVWFDLETTGISTTSDRIIEICMIKTDLDGNEIESYRSLVNPGITEMRPEAQDKHGISIEDLSDQPSFESIASEINDFIGDCDLGGYNALYFDVPFLCEEFMRCGIAFNHRSRAVLDPFLIYSNYEKRDLTNTYKKYTGKDLEGAHRAEADVRATMEIFQVQRELYSMAATAEEIDKEVNTRRADQVDLGGKLKFAEVDEKRTIVFNFGKHKGIPFKTVYANDARYLTWIIEKGEFSQELKIICKKLIEKFKQEQENKNIELPY
jgi:DNA polymerase-3 subunit epsilon